jgi:hypothetical protein
LVAEDFAIFPACPSSRLLGKEGREGGQDWRGWSKGNNKKEREDIIMIRTEKQFRKYMSDAAKDVMADGHDLDQCAGDLADSMFYDPDVRGYVNRKMPWIKTKTQWRECIADYIVG